MLEYVTTQKLTDLLDDDEKADYPITVSSYNGVTQERLYAVISESGVYHAIFKSRKPEAQAFRKWVTSEARREGSGCEARCNC